MVINIGLALALYRTLQAGGLALSNGIAVTIEVLIMLVIAHRRMGGVEGASTFNTLIRTLLAAGAMGLTVIAFTTLFPSLPPVVIAAVGGTLGIMVYLIVGLMLGLKEIQLIPRLVGR